MLARNLRATIKPLTSRNGLLDLWMTILPRSAKLSTPLARRLHGARRNKPRDRKGLAAASAKIACGFNFAPNKGCGMAEPYCLAMVLCDAIHRDPATGKCTILGTFSAFHPRQLPAKVRFAVYAEVTDGIGEVEFVLRIVESRSLLDDSGDEPFVWKPDQSPKVTLENPLAVLQMTFLCATELPKAGQYHCELLANGVPLMARRVIVMPPQEQSQADDEKE